MSDTPVAGRSSALTWISLAVVAGLAVVPFALLLLGNAFWLDIFTRLVILAIAACGLNLILGLGGLVSFGHAAYIGLGAYAVGIPVYHATYGGMDCLLYTSPSPRDS